LSHSRIGQHSRLYKVALVPFKIFI
jgi:hypothetical protein